MNEPITKDQGLSNENPSSPTKRKTSVVLRAMADRELTEGNSKLQLAQILRDAADVCERMESQS